MCTHINVYIHVYIYIYIYVYLLYTYTFTICICLCVYIYMKRDLFIVVYVSIGTDIGISKQAGFLFGKRYPTHPIGISFLRSGVCLLAAQETAFQY